MVRLQNVLMRAGYSIAVPGAEGGGEVGRIVAQLEAALCEMEMP